MAEQVDLTFPVLPKGGTNFWRVDVLRLFRIAQRVDIVLMGENGETLSHTYTGAEATSLMISLNKANLSIKSLHRRIMEKLIADGILQGSISGIVD